MTTPVKAQGKRAYVRITKGDIVKLCEVREISVQVFVNESALAGSMVDVGVGGLAVELPVPLDLDLALGVEFTLGERTISCRGVTRQIRTVAERFVLGIMFVSLAKEDATYIDGIVHIQLLLSQLNAGQDITAMPQHDVSFLCKELHLISQVFLTEPYQHFLSRRWWQVCQ